MQDVLDADQIATRYMARFRDGMKMSTFPDTTIFYQYIAKVAVITQGGGGSTKTQF